MKYLFILCCMSIGFVHAQTPYPPVFIDGSQPWTSGNINLSNVDNIIYYNSATQNSEVDLKASNEIVLTPGAVAGEYTGTGNFHASIQPEALGVVSFHPNGWLNIPRYDRFEMGIKLPASVQSQINAFLSGQTGLNPYDPDQIKIECNYNNGAYTRYGFYYRDYKVQNNTWIEQPTDYTFRIRIAPEQLVSNKAFISLYINGILTDTVTRYFGTQSSGNLGHLEMANGNLLKMQYNNGQVFFGIGQNIAYPIPDNVYGNCKAGDCNSPYTFQKQREYLTDLAANGGNFTRVRLDALNMLCEWPYRQELNTDPAPTNKPLSSYLTNYNDNQRYLWEYDQTFQTMENTGIKAVLCLLQDQAFSTYGAYDPHQLYTWNNNPYSTITGNNLAGCKAFFTNPQSIATYRKWLYYVQARYGYSTSIAMWQLINETANVAKFTSGVHTIDVDQSFNTDLKNWVYDTKFILQQQYPSRPVTTGYISDTNQHAQNYINLNVWSSNSYHGYTSKNKYEDPDYETRGNAMLQPGSGYFTQSNPFFWGELGVGDSANIMDRKSDRCFHNAVWASAFTGGISSGLYWNDWDQKYGVNHRKNFQALRAFVDMIDFSQRLTPGKSKDMGTLGTAYHDREIHTWWLRNSAKNFIAGWTKNNSANIFQDLGNLTQPERDQVVLATRIYEYTIAQYTCFSTNQNPQTTIDGILPWTSYRIKIYNTYNNANEEDSFTETTNAGGKLTFRRTMPWYNDDPFNPDYAFIIKPASTWRMSNTNEITATDTVYLLTSEISTLKSLFVKNNSSYTFSWSGALNNLNSENSSVDVSYKNEGNYIVDMEARSNDNDTSVMQRFFIIVSDKALHDDLNRLIIYPNPANNYVYLYYDESFKNPVVTCVDMLGKEYKFNQIEQFKFDTSTLPNGMFLIKFKHGYYEKVLKINVIH